MDKRLQNKVWIQNFQMIKYLLVKKTIIIGNRNCNFTSFKRPNEFDVQKNESYF